MSQVAGKKKKVTRIVCFGLGDLDFKPPDWWRMGNNSKPGHEQEAETCVTEGALTHHAIALTMASVARASFGAGDTGGVRLLTQDPRYSDESKELLRELGFEVVEDHGAGGFAEVDDESVVFSAFANVPFTQIITDLARPAVIICARGTSATVYCVRSSRVCIQSQSSFHFYDCVPNICPRKLWGDPGSPRTKQMWKRYKSFDFPVPPEDAKLEGSLQQLAIRAKIEK